MSYRELTMIDIREMLRRRAAGQSVREVARATGFDRKTVSRYFAAATSVAVPIDRDPTDDEVHAVATLVQARPTADATAEWREVAAHRARIEAWLAQKRPLKLRKIHTLLHRDHGLAASYDTLRRFAIEELGWRKKITTVRLAETAPGQVAQVDFGLMGLVVDTITGRTRRIWVLVVTLAFSRFQFVWPSFEQTTEAVCDGLDAAWRFFGAMPEVIVPDNMSARIARADELGPTFVPAFLDYIQARGLFVDAARVRAPKDKARVENQVAYVRESWFDGESFVGLDDARGWVNSFVAWYNHEHRHGGIRYVTPSDRHAGRDKALLAKRRTVYAATRSRAPRRWTGPTWTGPRSAPSSSTLSPTRSERRPSPCPSRFRDQP